jgi:hypothetical protein
MSRSPAPALSRRDALPASAVRAELAQLRELVTLSVSASVTFALLAFLWMRRTTKLVSTLELSVQETVTWPNMRGTVPVTFTVRGVDGAIAINQDVGGCGGRMQ